jgi:hypothetical protein
MNRRRVEARKQKLAERSGGAVVAAPIAAADPIETLIGRSRRERARGDIRRAVVLLRQACALDEGRARTWTLLGALLGRTGARDEALRALRQARWLRNRAGETEGAEPADVEVLALGADAVRGRLLADAAGAGRPFHDVTFLVEDRGEQGLALASAGRLESVHDLASLPGEARCRDRPEGIGPKA